MILYEEVSDEVEWRHRTFRLKTTSPVADDLNPSPENASGEEPKGSGRPDVTGSTLLRKFLREAALPFVNASMGNTAYAVFFILSIVLITGIIVLPLNR